MTKYISIKIKGLGADAGPFFNLYSNVDNFSSPIRENVSVLSLSAGYILEVDELVNQIRVKSIGICTNYVDTLIPC